MTQITINDLIIDESGLIGRGSFATCHLCYLRSDPDQKKIVLKLLQPKVKDQQGMVNKWCSKRLRSEINITIELSKLRPCFVKFLHLCSDNYEIIGYTMEYCLHKSMRTCNATLKSLHLRSERFPWLNANWMLQVADAFKFLQEDRPDKIILHRDLAVDNVLITEELQVKIADFGMTKKEQDESTLGTYNFEKKRGFERRLPELLNDPLVDTDAAGDRYLFGILLIEAFTGESLRQGISNEEEFIQRVKRNQHVTDFISMLRTSLSQHPFNLRQLDDNGDAYRKLIEVVCNIVQSCVQSNPNDRMKFSEIITMCANNLNQERINEETNYVINAFHIHLTRQLQLHQQQLHQQQLQQQQNQQQQNQQQQKQQQQNQQKQQLQQQQHPIRPQIPYSSNEERLQELPVNQAITSIEFRNQAAQQQAAAAPAAAAPAPAAAAAARTGNRKKVKKGLNIEIGTVLHNFQDLAPSASARTVARSYDSGPRGDEAELMQRAFSDRQLSQQELEQLAKCQSVSEHWISLLQQLDINENVLTDLRNIQDSYSDQDMLLRGLQELSKPSFKSMAEAMRKFACFQGLRLLCQLDQ